MKKNKINVVLLMITVLFTALVVSACGGTKAPEAAPEQLKEPEPAPLVEPAKESEPAPAPEVVEKKGTIILSTTTSTQDSGLLDYLLPMFTEETGWEVDTIAVGTGAALQMGRDGEADVLLVHSKADEEKFVEEGFGVERFDVMYNDYVIVGKKDGEIAYNEDAKATFTQIKDDDLKFVSRGDDSGTHKKELSIWKSLDIDPETLSDYVSAGSGMGATLQMAGEMEAYTLSDRATYLTTKGLDLDVVCEKSPELLNYYGVIAVTPTLNDKINAEGGQAFVDWMISKNAQDKIGEFGVAEYGQPLFTPNAK